MYSIEFNPLKWSLSDFSPTRIKEYWKEKAQESELFQLFASEVRELTQGNMYHVEIDPNKWEEEDFSCKNIVGFWTEKLNGTLFCPIIVPIGKFIAKIIEPKTSSIKNLSQTDATYTRFAYIATQNARDLQTVNENYEEIKLKQYEDTDSGFEAFIQRDKNAKRTIISFKDTDDFKDLASDYQLANGDMPDQLIPALEIYQEILEKYPDDEIIITGYSLGGSLTEIVCSSPEAQQHGKTRGFSFNGYGTDGNLSNCGMGYKDINNVICISASTDIAIGNGSHHVGRDYIAETTSDFIDAHGLSQLEESILSLKTDKNTSEELFGKKPLNIFKKTANYSKRAGLLTKVKHMTQKITNSIKGFVGNLFA